MAWVNFTSFQFNSATNPTDYLVGYIGTYEQRYPVYSLKNGLSAGTFSVDDLYVRCDANIDGNTTILGNLTVLGDMSVIETRVSVTSALSVVNTGTGPAVYIQQTGTEPVALFLDDTNNHLRLDDGLRTSFYNSTATASYAVAEGNNTKALSVNSHSEGSNTVASGDSSHAEGYYTSATNSYTHSEGDETLASGVRSHAEGYRTVASNFMSHAEGSNSVASGLVTHAEGLNNIASGNYSHAAGSYSQAAHDRTFIWKGSTETSLTSTTRTDQFVVSAAGGVYFPGNVGIKTDNNNNALTVYGSISSSNGNVVLGNDPVDSNGRFKGFGLASNIVIGSVNTSPNLDIYTQKNGNVIIGNKNILGEPIAILGMGTSTQILLTYGSLSALQPLAVANLQPGNVIPFSAGLVGSTYSGSFTVASTGRSISPPRDIINSVEALPVGPPVSHIYLQGGASNSFVAGHGNIVHSTPNGAAVGIGNYIGGYSSTAFGLNNKVYNYEGTAFGLHNSLSGDYAFAVGRNNTTSSNYGFAIGSYVSANQSNSMAIKADGSTDFNFPNGAIPLNTRQGQMSLSASGGYYFHGGLVGINTDSIANTLTVNGTLSASNNVTAGNSLTVTNDLTVNGNTTLGNANTDTVTINAGPVSLVNATAAGDALEFGSGANLANLYRSANDTLRTDDSFVVGTNLTVAGTSTLQNNTTVNGTLSASGNVTAANSLTVTNDLTVNGNTTLGNNASDTVTINAGPVSLVNATAAGDALEFGSGANLANLYRSANDTLRTDDNFVVGNLDSGFTDDVVINFSGLLQERIINTRVWDTNATFLSGNSLTNNFLPKAEGSGNRRLSNSRISDDASNITLGGNTLLQGTLSTNNTGFFGNNLTVQGIISASGGSTIGNTTILGQITATATNYQGLTSSTTIGAPSGLDAITRDPNAHLFLGKVGINTIPLSSYALQIKYGNVRVDGIDYSDVPGMAPILDTDGQCILDLRSPSPSADYNFAVGTSTRNHYLKFFGGRDPKVGDTNLNDANPFIAFKSTDSLRFAKAPDSFFTGGGFTEVGRFDLSGNFGVGQFDNVAALPARCTILGGISAQRSIISTQTVFASGGLDTTGSIRAGTLGAGSTNTIITHSGNVLQTRSANTRIFDTNATFLSGSSLSNNCIPKNEGTGNQRLVNSLITDNGSTVLVAGTLSATGDVGIQTTSLGSLSSANLKGIVSYNTATLANPGVGLRVDIVIGGGTQTFILPLYTYS